MNDNTHIPTCWYVVTGMLIAGSTLIAVDAPGVGDETVLGTILLAWASIIMLGRTVINEIRQQVSHGYQQGFDDGRRVGSVIDLHR